MEMFKKMLHAVLPPTCLLCTHRATPAFDLCEPCYNDLPRLHYSCATCARPFQRFQTDERCEYCQKNPSLPFERTFALYSYQQPVTKLIMDLKFGQALVNAKLLGQLLAEKIRTEWYKERPLPEVIIPIPLHKKRLKERGYNQAVEIGKPIAKHLNLPLARHLCQRIKHTAPQATLAAKQREQNVHQAFHLNEKLVFSHVAVLDDVITTGATMTAFCLLLKQSGAQTIDVWSCSRPNK